MIPKEVRQKFSVHRADAKRRGIEFLFTLEQWWEWWITDNRWANRGRGTGKLVMARVGDSGPYHPDNVYCATYERNNADVGHMKRSEGARRFHAERRARGLQSNLAVRGAAHPKARAVVTPAGRFESGALAADHFGVTKEAIYYRIGRAPGYSWADKNK